MAVKHFSDFREPECQGVSGWILVFAETWEQALHVVSGFRVHAKADTRGIDTGGFVHMGSQGGGDSWHTLPTGRPHGAGHIGLCARRDAEQITGGT